MLRLLFGVQQDGGSTNGPHLVFRVSLYFRGRGLYFATYLPKAVLGCRKAKLIERYPGPSSRATPPDLCLEGEGIGDPSLSVHALNESFVMSGAPTIDPWICSN